MAAINLKAEDVEQFNLCIIQCDGIVIELLERGSKAQNDENTEIHGEAADANLPPAS
jgi:hypothetical protein